MQTKPKAGLIALTQRHIDILERVATYLKDSEGDDYFDNGCPENHLYNDAITLEAMASIATQELRR